MRRLADLNADLDLDNARRELMEDAEEHYPDLIARELAPARPDRRGGLFPRPDDRELGEFELVAHRAIDDAVLALAHGQPEDYPVARHDDLWAPSRELPGSTPAGVLFEQLVFLMRSFPVIYRRVENALTDLDRAKTEVDYCVEPRCVTQVARAVVVLIGGR